MTAAAGSGHRPPPAGRRARRSASVAAVVSLVLVGLVTTVAPAVARPTWESRPIRLEPGEPRFWDGVHIEKVYRPIEAEVTSVYRVIEDEWIAAVAPSVVRQYAPVVPDACELEPERGPCFRYQLIVPDLPDLDDHRLRIGVSWGIAPHRDTTGTPFVDRGPWAEANGQATVEVYAPNGDRVARSTRWWYDHQDLRIPGEALTGGAWTVRVIPVEVEDATFRVRALLEADVDETPEGDVLPNLRAIPPFDFTFKLPGGSMCNEPGIGTVLCVNLPDEPLGSDYPVTCTADELADERGVARCLRVALGFENAGPGPLEIRYGTEDVDVAGRTPQPRATATQVIHGFDHDGEPTERANPRPTYAEWHVSHGHFHVESILDISWYRVVDNDQLVDAGVGRKVSMCFADEKLADWYLFYQAPIADGRTSCEAPGGDGRYVQWLSSGWGDVYEWNRPHNYIPVDGDGEYVLRVIANPGRLLLETTDHDNVSYAHVEIEGSAVRLLERGYGNDPWDEEKIVSGNW